MPKTDNFIIRMGLGILALAACKLGAENVLPNGDFEILNPNGRTPAGWKMQNGKLMEKNGNHWVRFENGGRIKRAIELKPQWRILRISARMRAQRLQPGPETWNNARVIVRFFKKIGGKPIYTPAPELKTNSDWGTVEKVVEVPQGATILDLEAGIFMARGIAEFDDLCVIPVDEKAADRDAALPPGEKLYWGEEPVIEESSTRGYLVLNGLWQFMPARQGMVRPSTRGWGYCRVPGSWTQSWRYPGMVAWGEGKAWQQLDLKTLTKAWYRRRFKVPKAWRGRKIVLDFQRVSTDARVRVNGRDCGSIAWPYGEVDISSAVRFDAWNEVEVLVVAAGNAADVVVFMGPNQVTRRKSSLATRGITGDVLLCSRPGRGAVRDLFVETSFRRKRLVLQFDLNEPPPAGTHVSVIARLYPRHGKVAEKVFRQTLVYSTGKRLRCDWGWGNPRLWDYRRPNLYRLELTVQTPGTKDVFVETIGFREFWIEGKSFYLNGRKFRLRPEYNMGYQANNELVAEGMIRGLLAAGFNCLEFWPNDHNKRGYAEAAARELWVRKADELGLPVIASAMDMAHLVETWHRPGVKQNWLKVMERDLKRYWNHPSVIMWVHSGNRFGHRDDQNPLRIGRKAPGEFKRADRDIAEEACRLIRSVDPTRPVMSHECGPVGAVYTLNNYLCMTPLQEREEWLSHWAKHGDMPYMAVEFGLPLDSTLSRGRNGGHRAGVDEMFPTEYPAIYLGEKAYLMESATLRKNMRCLETAIQERKRKGGAPAWHWNTGILTADDEDMTAYQALLELFIRNTWRSWRTMGITGGMVPWGIARLGWRSFSHVEKAAWGPDIPFRPGQRGMYYRKIRKTYLYYMQEKGNKRELPAGRTIKAVNRETLAWIAGAPNQWVAKDHHFESGRELTKQVALLNDLNDRVAWTYTVILKVANHVIARRKAAGSISPGETLLKAFTFRLPQVEKKTPAELILQATIGPHSHSEHFSLRIYPPLERYTGSPVALFDPVGDTARLLASAAIPYRPVKTIEPNLKILIIGRNALCHAYPPGDLQAFVRRGGRLLIQQHRPQWIRDHWGLRVSHHVARRVWPLTTCSTHPILNGLDGEDFRDWNGAGTLVPSHDTALRDPNGDAPSVYNHGWHWGNRGSVSSAMIEKPHFSGWIPLLEGDFDLAFSPLMEWRLGRGRVILNMLDMEGRTAHEPMVSRLLTRIIHHLARELPAMPSSPVRLAAFGGPRMQQWLRQAGITAVKPQDANLVLAEGDRISTAKIKAFLQQGVSVILTAPSRPVFSDQRLIPVTGRFTGWPRNKLPEWCRGISASENHIRYHVKANNLAGPQTTIFGDGLLTLTSPGGAQAGRLWSLAIAPWQLPVTEESFLRFSRWRLSSLLSRILANENLAFTGDLKILPGHRRGLKPLSLAGRADMLIERRTSRLSSRPWTVREVMKKDGWLPCTIPGPWENGAWNQFDGAVWVRRKLTLPPSWRGKQLTLELGPVDDFDWTWVNGELIGHTGPDTPLFYAHPRRYIVPARLTAGGTITIAIRVWDHFGGGGFYADSPGQLSLLCFEANPSRIPLAGTWQCRIERALAPAPSLKHVHTDPGIAAHARSWMKPDLSTTGWVPVQLPGPFEQRLAEFDGVVWYRLRVHIPPQYAGYSPILELGPIGDEDTVYWNGRQIGHGSGRTVARSYRVPPTVVSPGRENEILIRIVNHQGTGGFLGKNASLRLSIPGIPENCLWYHPDYRDDYWRGDDHTRYYRW